MRSFRFSLAVGKGLREKSYLFLLAHEAIKNRLNFEEQAHDPARGKIFW